MLHTTTKGYGVLSTELREMPWREPGQEEEEEVRGRREVPAAALGLVEVYLRNIKELLRLRQVLSYIVAHGAMAYIVMAYIVIAYIVIAYVVMALCNIKELLRLRQVWTHRHIPASTPTRLGACMRQASMLAHIHAQPTDRSTTRSAR